MIFCDAAQLKNKVRHQFNRAASTYDHNNHIQIQALIRILKCIVKRRKQFKTVIDLGCGTGESTVGLLNTIQYEYMLAVDIADQLLDLAVKKCDGYQVQFLNADFDAVNFKNNCFDLMMINMGLQWSLQLPQTLKQLSNSLQVGGILAFTMPLVGTFIELAADKTNPFVHGEHMIHLLATLGFSQIEFKTYIEQQRFESEVLRLKSIKAVGATTLLPKMNDNNNVLINHNHLAHDPTLTYRIGIFIAIKGEP